VGYRVGVAVKSLRHRYNRISWDPEKIEDLLIDLFVEHFHETPKEIILDFDATDIPLHGDQESRFFNGYYDNYCYLPLYCFSGSWPLIAKLRPSNIDLDIPVQTCHRFWLKTAG
jgi:hypothetical protein